ncbi:hypothetical protein NQ314_015855 [Rhamnusium bicolor]|uniref:K Homology domain-containing protein n=1 Tax=Rhamnusium bicolor TaxID=1586634 RepID=A0AAV8WYE1_9CUCU|nr:hypothetical protein NQ314_015855 [Rhamnusium bicolor]
MRVITKSLTAFLGLTVCGISGYLLYLMFRNDDEDDLIDTYAYVSKYKTLEIKVPKDMVRVLIGRNGKSIKLIQEQSNTRINFKEREGSEERICIIRGSIESCNIAENLIQEFISNQPVLESEDIWIPMGCVGKIIGRCGEKITEIRSLSGAKLTINDEEKDFTLKRITIKGTKEQINIAKSLVEDIVEQATESQQRIEASLLKREPRLPPKSSENLKIVESPKVERISPIPGKFKFDSLPFFINVKFQFIVFI